MSAFKCSPFALLKFGQVEKIVLPSRTYFLSEVVMHFFLAGDEINRACNLFNSGLRFQHDFEPPNLLTPICQRAKRGKWERHRIRKSLHFSYEIIFLDIHAEESVIQAVKSRLSFARKSPTNEDHENLRKITDFFWALGPQVILLPGIKLTPGRGLA